MVELNSGFHEKDSFYSPESGESYIQGIMAYDNLLKKNDLKKNYNTLFVKMAFTGEHQTRKFLDKAAEKYAMVCIYSNLIVHTVTMT